MFTTSVKRLKQTAKKVKFILFICFYFVQLCWTSKNLLSIRKKTLN